MTETIRSLAGKIALVTGAAGPGLGFSSARLLASSGAHVVVADRSSRRVAEAVEILTAEYPEVRIYPLVLDVSDEVGVQSGVAEIIAELGGVDILVNNAAIAESARIVDVTLASWNRVLAVSLTGPMLLMRACIPSMVSRGGGAVVNVSSVEAWANMDPDISSYSAAKAGLLALTRAAASEYGRDGVRVNAVAPGLMVNKAVEKLFDADHLARVVERTPLGRAGDPEEVARVVLFLASEQSAFVTGDVVTAAGGLYYHA